MVILGAGLAGLSAAYHGGGIVYEKEDEVGGTCRSLCSEGYIFDLGIHVLHSKNSYILNLLSKDKKLGLKTKKRSAWIYSHKVLTKYPFQANTYGLPKHIVKECLAGFAKAIGQPAHNYENYAEWVYSAFGRGIAENFYLPYSEKFWTVKAKELTTDWLDVRVPRPSLKQVIAGSQSVQKEEFGSNALFQYPQYGGIQRIAQALLKKSFRVITGKEAVRIELDKKIIHFRDGTATNYKKLVSTLPLPELCRIISRLPEPVTRAVSGLRHNSVLCVNLGIKRQDLSDSHWVYFPEEDFAPFRISFLKNFSRFTVPKGYSSVQAEISYSDSKPIGYRDIVEKVIQDLIKASILKAKDNIKLINTKDVKYAYVIYDHKRPGNLKVINCFLRKNSIYNAGRYGRWEYLWMDEAILSGQRVVSEIRGERQ